MHIEHMTTAVNHMAAMVRFYNAVFGAGLEPTGPEMDDRFHQGTLDGKTVVFAQIASLRLMPVRTGSNFVLL